MSSPREDEGSSQQAEARGDNEALNIAPVFSNVVQSHERVPDDGNAIIQKPTSLTHELCSEKVDVETLRTDLSSVHASDRGGHREVDDESDPGDVDESLDCEEAQSEIVMPQKLRALCENNKTLYETTSRSAVTGEIAKISLAGLAEGTVNSAPAVPTPHRSMPGLRGPTPSNCSREGSASFQDSRPFAQRPVLQQGPLKDLISWLKEADVDDVLDPSCLHDLPANVETAGRKIPPAGLTHNTKRSNGSEKSPDVVASFSEAGALWDSDDDGEDVPSDREGGLPTAPPLAAQAIPSMHAMRPCTPEATTPKENPLPGCILPSNISTEPNEEDEWLARQRVTGAIGRLVRYAEGDLSPKDDILGLRATTRGRIMVTAVREGGIAFKAGVAAGDELVSINGRKEFIGHPAHVVHASLRAPATLVFCGFVGKLQAEVRVKRPPEPKCGFAPNTDVITPNATTERTPVPSVQVCDAVVFQQGESSLMLATSGANDKNNRLYDDDGLRDQKKSTVVYEIQREDARNLIFNSLVPEVPSHNGTLATL